MSMANGFLHTVLSPSPLGLLIAIAVVLCTPLFLHYFVFRPKGVTVLPSILLIGPSGSGKTSLLALLERGASMCTHTSQTPICVECSLPIGSVAGSDKYRSVNDPENLAHKKFLLIDTPGHGKLRYHALRNLSGAQNIKGFIFLIDAATLSADGEERRKTADYFYDVLLMLQKAMTSGKQAFREVGVLVAANKMDLFTALPAALVKSTLEAEVTKIRLSRSKGLLDSGIGMGDGLEPEKDDWLGEVGSPVFKFSQMEEFSISIQVHGGNVVNGQGPSIEKWWKWISDRL